MRAPISLLVLTLAAIAACTKPVDVERERTALLAADHEWMQAARDADKFASFYAPDAALYQTGMPVVKGQAAIREGFKQLTSTPGFSLEWTQASTHVGAAGDVAYITGNYDIKLGDGGEKGKYVTIWRKQPDGSWKVTDDIFNSDAPAAPPAAVPGKHTLLVPPQLTWGDQPPALPPGGKLAVLSGDPSSSAPFVLRAELPAGYKVPPHWHPTDEHVTVLAGTFAFGMGDTLDTAAMTDISAGGYALMPAQMHHYAVAKTPVTIQVHGIGPFEITYVNPADDPRAKK
ncbi:MAG TPA: DUF4440 domain-containing protein [Gammaproteobacteria bacterium]|nr:DUF4440 domain-containing protein [Gammaproteobacteria bacterium]